nr:MAG TPA: hypothetical protein [Bacteriophage sp.]
MGGALRSPLPTYLLSPRTSRLVSLVESAARPHRTLYEAILPLLVELAL